MINPMKYKYLVAIVAQNKKAYDITQLVENVEWEEGENQLASRISFTAKNEKTAKGQISSLVKPGCYVGLLYSYNGGKKAEAVRGKVVEWNPSAKMSSEILKIKAYDVLYDLQESQDNIYFSSGTKTKNAISQLLKKWGVKIAFYSGPNVKHGKLLYKTEKLGTVIVKILKDARKKGGCDAVLRSEKLKVSVIGYGSNSTVYHFEEKQHLTEVNHKISTTGMVTRVKIIGKQKKNRAVPVQATVSGKTEYGIRQKIITRSKGTSLKAAKKEAKTVLEDEGKPKDTISIKLPDIPVIRKGDKIHLKTSSISAGYYCVISVTHNIDDMMMTLGLKRASDCKMADDEAETPAKTYHVGDIVNFHGGKYYSSSNSKSKGSSAAAGKAKITKKSGSGKKHTWYLTTQNWKKSKVHGWVDSGSFD